MANQYRSALHEAADQLAADIAKYHIEVDAGERMVVWRDKVEGVPLYTTKPKCLAILRKFIRRAKTIEAKEYEAAHQSSLLDM